jgi:hypothetical protein
MKRFLAGVLACVALALAARAANELTAQVAVRFVDGYVDLQRGANASWTVTNASPNVAADSVGVTTNAAALAFGAVSVKGWTWFRNVTAAGGDTIALGVVDASTNFIEFARMKPGEYGLIRLGTSAIWAQKIGTNETSSRLEKMCVDD